MADEENILQELSGGTGDNMVNEFASYEDYLDSQISATDLYYLEDEVRARARGETVPRERRLRRAQTVAPCETQPPARPFVPCHARRATGPCAAAR
jgi:hypothetical protein